MALKGISYLTMTPFMPPDIKEARLVKMLKYPRGRIETISYRGAGDHGEPYVAAEA